MKDYFTMNTTLIPTISGSLDGQTQALVNARDLHQFLESKQHFADWIKNRINEYGFTQDVDFLGVHTVMSTEAGFFGRREKTVTDYHLSLDMAKELCMVERNDKGRQARRYFIEMEKQAKALPDAVLYRIDALEDAYFQAAPEMLALLRYRSMGLNLTEIGKLLDMNPGAVSYRLKKLNDLGFLEYVPKPKMVVQQQSLGLEG
ncbi:MAG: antA/AntB antirepressor family protein [Neisseria sp.]|nr:antA/AntB antirepressor family protein [Neisseria sp.]